MNEVQSIPTVTLNVIEGKVVTTSRAVAERFGKRHADVIRAIKNVECSDEFNQRNFAPVEYMDEKGEMRPEYRITRDGFVFLAMGFTGKEAAKWKEAYILAFNRMEQELIEGRSLSVSVYERALAAERNEAKSFALAQTGSRLMRLRKGEKKRLLQEVALMRDYVQLRLSIGFDGE